MRQGRQGLLLLASKNLPRRCWRQSCRESALPRHEETAAVDQTSAFLTEALLETLQCAGSAGGTLPFPSSRVYAAHRYTPRLSSRTSACVLIAAGGVPTLYSAYGTIVVLRVVRVAGGA